MNERKFCHQMFDRIIDGTAAEIQAEFGVEDEERDYTRAIVFNVMKFVDDQQGDETLSNDEITEKFMEGVEDQLLSDGIELDSIGGQRAIEINRRIISRVLEGFDQVTASIEVRN